MFTFNKLARSSLLSILLLSTIDAGASSPEDDLPPLFPNLDVTSLPDVEIEPLADFDIDQAFEQAFQKEPIDALRHDALAEYEREKRLEQEELQLKLRQAEEEAKLARETYIRHVQEVNLAKLPLSDENPESALNVAKNLNDLIKDDKNSEAAYVLAKIYFEGRISCAAEKVGLEAPVKKTRGRKKKVAPQASKADQQRFNMSKAQEYLEKADALGHPDAKFELSQFYLKGLNGIVDRSKAYDLLVKAASVGHVKSLHHLGMAHLETGQRMLDKLNARIYFGLAQQHFHAAALRGRYIPSLFALGNIAKQGLMGFPDPLTAFWYFLEVIESGDATWNDKIDWTYMSSVLYYVSDDMQSRFIKAYTQKTYISTWLTELDKSVLAKTDIHFLGDLAGDLVLPTTQEEVEIQKWLDMEAASRVKDEPSFSESGPGTDEQRQPKRTEREELPKEPVAPEMKVSTSSNGLTENYMDPRPPESSTVKVASEKKRAKRK